MLIYKAGESSGKGGRGGGGGWGGFLSRQFCQLINIFNFEGKERRGSLFAKKERKKIRMLVPGDRGKLPGIPHAILVTRKYLLFVDAYRFRRLPLLSLSFSGKRHQSEVNTKA